MPVLGLVVVRHGELLAAVLLLTPLAGRAVQAGVNDAPDSDVVPHLHLLHLAPNLGDHAGQLVPRHARVAGGAQVVVGKVDVGVADAAVLDVKLHVARAALVPLDATAI